MKPPAAPAEIDTWAQIYTQSADQLSWKEQFQWLICFVFLTALYNVARRAPKIHTFTHAPNLLKQTYGNK